MTLAIPPAIERLPYDATFAEPATDAAIERTAAALRAHNFEVEIVEDGDAARDLVLGRIPTGAEVHGGASKTIDGIGLSAILEGSGDYSALRPRLRSMDRRTQGDLIRKLGAAPDHYVNSIQAVTEDGKLVGASFGGSQLGPIAAGAGHVYLVVGSQKIVPDLETALRRIETYSYPLEDVRLQEAYGMRSSINKILIVNGEFSTRTTVILVRQPIGD
jgi:hypothetical protein